MTREGKDQLSSDPAAHQGKGLLPLCPKSFGGLQGPCPGIRALCLARAAHLLHQPWVRALLDAPCQLCPYDPVLITQRKICF